MNIQTIFYFKELSSHLNYSKAAEKCFISRQAIKQQIDSLEKELGYKLFINQNNHLSLTKEGQLFLKSCSKLIAAYSRFEKEVYNIKPLDKNLKIAICSSLIPFQFNITKEDITAYERNNNISLDIKMTDYDSCMQLLENDKTDCAYVFELKQDSVYKEIEFLNQRVTIDHKTGLFNRKKELDIKDITKYNIVGLGKLETVFKPFYEDLVKENISINYNIEPSVFKAMAKIYEDTVMFDIPVDIYTDPRVAGTPFKRYSWFVGIKYKKENKKETDIIKFASFLKKNYPLKSEH